MIDQDPVYKRRAARLVQTLRDKGIRNDRILEAFENVPRHRFVGPGLKHRSYWDEALPIGMGQTISQPFTVAFQTQMLDVEAGARILEVGTGSGYQAAILVALGAKVYSVERHGKLLARARKILSEIECPVTTMVGDGTKGWPEHAPYDGIVVTAAAEQVPDPLLQQLKEPGEEGYGGRLVIPVGGPEGQTMMRITRTGPDDFEYKSSMQFRFVPLVGE